MHDAITHIYLCCLFFIITLSVYLFWRYVQQRTQRAIVNPLLLSLLSIVTLLIVSKTSYQNYMLGGQFLSAFIEPAVVVLGYPLYLQMQNIRKQWRLLTLLCTLGSLTAITSSVLLTKLFGVEDLIIRSISTLSITTAIAMEVTDRLGGSSALAALFVMIAGVSGSVFGVLWLNFLGIKNPMARGVSIGCSSHALGTATIAAESSVSAAYSSTALILTAIITALLVPILVPILLAF